MSFHGSDEMLGGSFHRGEHGHGGSINGLGGHLAGAGLAPRVEAIGLCRIGLQARCGISRADLSSASYEDDELLVFWVLERKGGVTGFSSGPHSAAVKT
jgi:hypothetical protein